MKLITRVRAHVWEALPDDAYALTERLSILHELQRLTLSELAGILQSVTPAIADRITNLLQGLPK